MGYSETENGGRGKTQIRKDRNESLDPIRTIAARNAYPDEMEAVLCYAQFSPTLFRHTGPL